MVGQRSKVTVVMTQAAEKDSKKKSKRYGWILMEFSGESQKLAKEERVLGDLEAFDISSCDSANRPNRGGGSGSWQDSESGDPECL